MKSEARISLSIAACSLAFLLTGSVQALASTNPTNSAGTRAKAGAGEATQMVRAEAVLLKSLDARDAQPGQQFRALLSDKVKLKDGTELPRGAELIGTVSRDNTHSNGASSLALRFTQADLKNGKTVPIKATIVSVYNTDSSEAADPNDWTPGVLQMVQENAISGVDLHSKIADANSGVFIAKGKDDVKLPQGFGIALAIAGRPGAMQSGSGSKGGA